MATSGWGIGRNIFKNVLQTPLTQAQISNVIVSPKHLIKPLIGATSEGSKGIISLFLWNWCNQSRKPDWSAQEKVWWVGDALWKIQDKVTGFTNPPSTPRGKLLGLPECWLQGWSDHYLLASNREGGINSKSTIDFSGVATCWVIPASEVGSWCISLLPVFISCVCWKGTFTCLLRQDSATTTMTAAEKCCLGANSLYSYIFYYCVSSALSRLQNFSFVPNGFFCLRGTRKGSR